MVKVRGHRLAYHLRKLGGLTTDAPSRTRPRLERLRECIVNETPRDDEEKFLIAYFKALDRGGEWKKEVFYFEGKRFLSMSNALSPIPTLRRLKEHTERLACLLNVTVCV